MCDCKNDEILKIHDRHVAAIKAMTATMQNANAALQKAYKALPKEAGPCFAIPEIGMMIEAGMNNAADILEGKVAA